MEPINYEELDPGIRKTVRFLRAHGFDTTDSGDGVSKVNGNLDWESMGIIPFPHVNIWFPIKNVQEAINEINRLHDLLNKFGIKLDGRFQNIELTYSPVRSDATIFVVGIDDTMIPDYNNALDEELDRLYQSMQTRTSKEAMQKAFEASPEELGEAAVWAAIQKRGNKS